MCVCVYFSPHLLAPSDCDARVEVVDARSAESNLTKLFLDLCLCLGGFYLLLECDDLLSVLVLVVRIVLQMYPGEREKERERMCDEVRRI